MLTRVRCIVLVFSVILPGHDLSAQINIDTTSTISSLVNNILLGSGVVVGNVKFIGEPHAIGLYSDNTGQIGIESGIVLTSGNAFYVVGPNKTPRSGWASDSPGDTELDRIARGKTHDAAILEFDFITQSENLSFEFVFASEEYLEYVGSKFNDVFAFFIEGPGLNRVNIARLPDGITPITINTVNNKLNHKYYIDNAYINTTDPFVWDVRNRKVIENKNYLLPEVPPAYNTQFDGFTTVLKAKCLVKPNEIYHIKISIADVGDGILDSGVFLKGGSFKSYGQQVVKIDKVINDREPKILAGLKPSINEINLTTRKIASQMRIGNIEFEFDKYVIPVQAKLTLTKVLREYYKHPDAKIRIRGHADNFGSDEYNITLSKNRSNTVASALMGLGIPEDRLMLEFYGETLPLQNNATPVGRARNRRVELIVAY